MKPESVENYQSDNKQFDDKDSQSLADKLEERLIDFAVRIVRLSASLPRTAAGKHIAGRFWDPERHPRQIMAKQEAPKAMLTLFTSYGSFSRNSMRHLYGFEFSNEAASWKWNYSPVLSRRIAICAGFSPHHWRRLGISEMKNDDCQMTNGKFSDE